LTAWCSSVRAPGDAHPDSDYDIAVFLKSLPDRWAELDRLADLPVKFLDETGAFLDAMRYLAASYRERTPLMHEIREEGLDLRPRKPRVFLKRPERFSIMPTSCSASILTMRLDARPALPDSTPEHEGVPMRRGDDNRSEKNQHWGSTLDDFLHEEGNYESAKAEAVTRMISWQIAERMRKL
jgi:hypothetical protein